MAFVAVNAEQAEDWNEASGREFIEERERHERMLGPLRARLLTSLVRDRLMAYASSEGVTMPAAI